MENASLKISQAARIAFWVSVAAVTWYFVNGANHFLEFTPAALGKYFNVRWLLILHITGGGAALVLGPPQFWPRFRARYRRLHRMVGVSYLAAILVSGCCAVVLAFTTAYEVTWAYAFSLQVWVGVWISASAIAYWAALKRKFKLHREWMTRSYMVTLAFVISGLAIKLPFVKNLGGFAEISPSLFWLAWAVPLYGYDVLLSLRRKA